MSIFYNSITLSIKILTNIMPTHIKLLWQERIICLFHIHRISLNHRFSSKCTSTCYFNLKKKKMTCDYLEMSGLVLKLRVSESSLLSRILISVLYLFGSDRYTWQQVCIRYPYVTRERTSLCIFWGYANCFSMVIACTIYYVPCSIFELVKQLILFMHKINITICL